MSLQSITNINIDLCDKKYILINAKQNDRKSRFFNVTCYDKGELVNLDPTNYSAYVRLRKPDNNGVFNVCTIQKDGNILVELTEQMLAVSGTSYVDLVIVDKGSAKVDANTGEITFIDSSAIISTMLFCIDVVETAVNNAEIESSYEYDGLNTLIEKAEAEYSEVIRMTKSYAMGNAGGIRANEDTDNAKYYYQLALDNATSARTSETNALASQQAAAASEANAKTSETNAKSSENKAKTSEVNSKTSETNAKSSEVNAKMYMDSAKTYMDSAKTSEANASTSETNAATSEANAKTYMDNAKQSENTAFDNYKLSESYAIGGTGARDNEDVTNAKYYCQVAKNIVDGLTGGFNPMGTITFEQLSVVEQGTGFVYNISNDFITDDRFREGAGKSYTAGTNVYYCADGTLDCLGGAASVTATVDEVKDYLGI